MGCAQSAGVYDEGKARNDEIELQLEKDAVEMKKEVRALLLGTEGSGKSTFLARMKLIHQGGYDDRERKLYRKVIFSSILRSMRAALEAMPALDLQLQPQHDVHRAVIMSLPNQIETEILSRGVVDALFNLWQDTGVRDAVRRDRRFQSNDSATYYLNSLERISSPTYLPTDRDIMGCRVKGADFTEAILRVGEFTYKTFHVRERHVCRKRDHYVFDIATTLLFLVSLDEYDKRTDLMQEALVLFDSACNSRWFARCPIILIMNKVDLFAEKLPHSPLGDYFPDYTGGNDYDAACNYILNRFVSLNRNAPRKIYTHFTCVTDTTDTQLAKFLLSTAQDMRLHT